MLTKMNFPNLLAIHTEESTGLFKKLKTLLVFEKSRYLYLYFKFKFFLRSRESKIIFNFYVLLL